MVSTAMINGITVSTARINGYMHIYSVVILLLFNINTRPLAEVLQLYKIDIISRILIPNYTSQLKPAK